MNNPSPAEIKAARVKAGLSQAKAAKLLHLDKTTWQAWEWDINPMPLDRWEHFHCLTSISDEQAGKDKLKLQGRRTHSNKSKS